MSQQTSRRKTRAPSSDDFAHDVNVPGPLRDLRKILDGNGAPGAPFTQNETAIVFAWLPPRQVWNADALAAVRSEIEECAADPEAARAFVDERLSTPFAERVREHVEAFANALPSWFRRMSDAMPDTSRVIVLQSAVLLLYDLAGCSSVRTPPNPESLPAAWRRNAS
ncbi:MAG: hypothetical protein WCO25_02465 [Candidatus Uhrbacteria bacterium]